MFLSGRLRFFLKASGVHEAVICPPFDYNHEAVLRIDRIRILNHF